LCQGAATIHGTLIADGEGSSWIGGSAVNGQAGGPGGFDGGGFQQDGFGPGGGRAGIGLYPAIHGGSASHATVGSTSNPFISPAPTYGSALPFDLVGGSGGGGPGMGNASSFGPSASGGGGAIAILAGGRITITGTVRARGGDIVLGSEYGWIYSRPGTGGNGSGGAILVRSLECVRVSGTIDATGGTAQVIGSQAYPLGGDGFVRIDSYTACGAPDLTGATIRPAPLTAPMPFLTALAPARIGQTYQVRIASAPGDVLGVYYSTGTSTVAVPPFGVLELDPTLILFLGQYSVPWAGDDPLANVDIAVPNLGALVGVTVHAQAFNAFGTITGQPRLSNRLVTTIGL
jgi:hypothetical protein